MKKRMLVALLCLATTPLAAAPSAPSSSPNSLAEQTAEYISAIMAVWSDPKEQLADVLDVVDLLYGQQVVYYGKTTNKKSVLEAALWIGLQQIQRRLRRLAVAQSYITACSGQKRAQVPSSTTRARCS